MKVIQMSLSRVFQLHGIIENDRVTRAPAVHMPHKISNILPLMNLLVFLNNLMQLVSVRDWNRIPLGIQESSLVVSFQSLILSVIH